MRETIFEVAEGETLGACATSPTPSRRRRRRWCGTCLRCCGCGSFAHREGLEPYPIDALSGIVRWQWAMDTDFSEATAYKILAYAGEMPQVSGGNPPRPRAGVAERHQLRRQMGQVHRRRWRGCGRHEAEVYGTDFDGVVDRASRADEADAADTARDALTRAPGASMRASPSRGRRRSVFSTFSRRSSYRASPSLAASLRAREQGCPRPVPGACAARHTRARTSGAGRASRCRSRRTSS